MTSRQDELAAWLGGGRLEEQVANGTGSITSTLYGTATANSSNGSVEVVFTDDVVNYEDEDGVVHGTTVVELPTEIDVREGDEVRITAVGPDGFKNLTVVGVVAGGDRSKEAIAAAQTAADEAQEAIDATNQLVWKDDNGVHVAEDQEQTGANLLANSLGVILRLGQNILSSMTASAYTIYDGLGNLASNVVASFGNTTTIGKNTGKAQVVIDSSSLSIVDPTDVSPSQTNYKFQVAYGETNSIYDDSTSQMVRQDGSYMSLGGRSSSPSLNRIGLDSVSLGTNDAYMTNSMAFGAGNKVAAVNGVAIGAGNEVGYLDSYAAVYANSHNAYALGHNNEVSGDDTMALGCENTAQHGALAAGSGCNADEGAKAFGTGLEATQLQNQTVIGQYNVDAAHPFIIGDGTDDNNRHNAFYIDSNGDAYANGGKLATGGTVLLNTATALIDGETSSSHNLSDSIENYKMLEVFFHDTNNNFDSMRIYTNGASTNVRAFIETGNASRRSSGTAYYYSEQYYKRIQFHGDSVYRLQYNASNPYEGYVRFGSANDANAVTVTRATAQTTYYITIDRIVGYK